MKLTYQKHTALTLKKEIEGPLTFRFGGKKQGMHEVYLKENFQQEKTSYKKVDSLYVVGDVHGRYDQLTNLLLKAHIIDENLNWIAGRSAYCFFRRRV